MSLDAPSVLAVKGASLSFGVVAARFNEELVSALLERLQSVLLRAGVEPGNITVIRVPGSHEVPWAVNALAQEGKRDCLIALGVLIGGDTSHHELVGESVSHALQRIAVETRVPVINGVIVANTRAQAEARTIGSINRGEEFAHAGLEMAALKRKYFR